MYLYIIISHHVYLAYQDMQWFITQDSESCIHAHPLQCIDNYTEINVQIKSSGSASFCPFQILTGILSFQFDYNIGSFNYIAKMIFHPCYAV